MRKTTLNQSRLFFIAFNSALSVRSLKHEVIELIECGFGYTAIANDFNMRGIASAYGKKWYPQTVKNVLTRLEWVCS